MHFLTDGIQNNIIEALTSMNLWTAIAKSLIIILVGFFLTRRKLLPEGTVKVLTKIVMLVALPCLAFVSFMTSITRADFISALFSFVYGFIVYIIFIFLSKLIFRWVKDPTKRKVLEIIFVFGSTTFFGQPLIQAIFPAAYNDSSMFNVAFRVFLYSYAYFEICLKDDNKEDKKEHNKKVLKNIFLNPILIATFLGFILWSLQLIGDSTDVSQWWVVNVNNKVGAFWNISVSVPWLYETLKALGNLSSPLVWLAIGCTLGRVSFKEAASDKHVWIYSFIKVIVGPLINFGLLYLINLIPGINVTFNTVAATTLMWAVPPSTVATTYCISMNKEPIMVSSCNLISTLISVLFIPIYTILLTVIQSSGFFA